MIYVDYVFCKTKTNNIEMCTAPAWSRLKDNDEVILEDEQRATVLKALTLAEDGDRDVIDVFNLIFTGKRKKVISQVRYIKLEYKEKEEG